MSSMRNAIFTTRYRFIIIENQLEHRVVQFQLKLAVLHNKMHIINKSRTES